MQTSASGVAIVGPREACERFRANVLAGQVGLHGDLLAADAVIELPFAPPGRPRRFESREEFMALAGRARPVLAGIVLRTHRPAVTGVGAGWHTRHGCGLVADRERYLIEAGRTVALEGSPRGRLIGLT